MYHKEQPVQVAVVQINNSFSGQNYLPYVAGLLQGYVEKHAQDASRYEFLLPIYCRRPLAEMETHLKDADVVGFSTYVWNINISLELAKRLKAEDPNKLIVFGGPQVPDQAEAFLREHPFVDLVVHGEGEQIFLQVLEAFPVGVKSDIPSTSYLDEHGQFVTNPRIARIRDLSVIPSPYTSNIFIPLMEANPDESWLILWETNRGCPFSCTFCDWGSATAAKVNRFELDTLLQEVEWFAKQKIEFVFCCDANFGILARDLDIVKFIAQIKEDSGYPHALSVQNTKNATERAYQVQKLLSDSGLNKGVTISFQSVDDNTLESIKRQNISTESFQELQRRFTRDKVETYTDLILGLPGETYETFAEGTSKIIENGQHNRIQFNNLSILPNAEMGDPEYQKKYGMETVKSRIYNIHGSLVDIEDEVPEIQELVIATHAMPRADWVKTRAFCWMTGLMHFDKILQMPLIVVHETCGIDYRTLIETFMDVDVKLYPILASVRDFFIEKAIDIQNGGSEYCNSKEWLNIGWPADEYILIKLVTEDNLAAFYDEAEALLSQLLEDNHLDLPPQLLSEAVHFNKCLMKLPFQVEDLEFKASYNFWEFYLAVREGASEPLEKEDCIYHIDRTSFTYDSWEQWYREVIWYGNKKGAYLYGNDMVSKQLAGHF